MSKESSPAEQFKPILASDTDETVTPVSHIFSVSDLTTSLEAASTEAEKKSTVVHHTQVSSPSGANRSPVSPDKGPEKDLTSTGKKICPPDVAGNRGGSWTVCPS